MFCDFFETLPFDFSLELYAEHSDARCHGGGFIVEIRSFDEIITE